MRGNISKLRQVSNSNAFKWGGLFYSSRREEVNLSFVLNLNLALSILPHDMADRLLEAIEGQLKHG